MPPFGWGDPADVRFWRHVRKSDGCWLWTSAVVSGYGHFTSDDRLPSGRKKSVKAHRFSWRLANGPIPGGMSVCHTCDVPLCVNPEHLFLGDTRANMADRHQKGRYQGLRGATNWNSKLTTEEADEIRDLAYATSARALATKYGLSLQGIYDIWQGKTWVKVG